MILGVIQKTRYEESVSLLSTLDSTLYHGVEVRLDALENLDIDKISHITFPQCTIFTLRSKAQGGFFNGTEKERILLLCKLMELAPPFIDLESDISANDIATIRSISPNTKIILSQHNFLGSPRCYDSMVSPMKDHASDVIYKFACKAESCLDALKLLVFCKQQKEPMIGISMGEKGETTRILAPVVHYGFSYCPIDESSAPGQIHASTLENDYNFSLLNHKTTIYGLLGDPVSQSVGHTFHNSLHRRNGINAVYVKWQLTKEELPQAMPLLEELNVKGLSVTMPLKEVAMKALTKKDSAVEHINAVNTLKATSQGWSGTNTDGAGALLGLNIPLAGKRVVFIGAGGAAKAVMYAVSQCTKNIVVYNRTTTKNLPIDVPILPLEEVPHVAEHDLIINGLSFDASFPYDSIPFTAGSVAFDLSYGKQSAFLAEAKAKGCTCVEGSSLFTQQALLQRKFWELPD